MDRDNKRYITLRQKDIGRHEFRTQRMYDTNNLMKAHQ